jgi:hypothetical protein
MSKEETLESVKIELENLKRISKTLLESLIERELIENGECPCWQFLPIFASVIEDKDYPFISFLLKNGYDPQSNYYNIDSICESSSDVIEILLKNGVDLNFFSKKESGDTVLHEACKRGDLKSVELLVTNGADVMKKNDKGILPINYAYENGHIEIINYLTKSLKK